jgi:GT2 family glycosyltransferase
MREIKEKSFFILIPTRDRKEHLLNFLADLNAFAPYISQCVIVDQSIDFIGDAIYYENYNFTIKCLKGNRTQGANHSRNLGLNEYCNEDWLFFLDDDLRVLPDEINKIPDYLSKNTIDCLILGNNEIRQKTEVRIKHNNLLDAVAKNVLLAHSCMRLLVSSGLSIIHTDAFSKAGFYFDEKFTFWGDDWDLGFRLYNSGAIIKFEPNINFTHLAVKTGGQRSFKEKNNIKNKKLYLELYFYKKHFGNVILRERVLVLLIKALFNFKLLNTYRIYKSYKKALQ